MNSNYKIIGIPQTINVKRKKEKRKQKQRNAHSNNYQILNVSYNYFNKDEEQSENFKWMIYQINRGRSTMLGKRNSDKFINKLVFSKNCYKNLKPEQNYWKDNINKSNQSLIKKFGYVKKMEIRPIDNKISFQIFQKIDKIFHAFINSKNDNPLISFSDDFLILSFKDFLAKNYNDKSILKKTSIYEFFYDKFKLTKKFNSLNSFEKLSAVMFLESNEYIKQTTPMNYHLHGISFALQESSLLKKTELVLEIFFKLLMKEYKQLHYHNYCTNENFFKNIEKKNQLKMGFLHYYFSEVSESTNNSLKYFFFKRNRFENSKNLLNYINSIFLSKLFEEKFIDFISEESFQNKKGIVMIPKFHYFKHFRENNDKLRKILSKYKETKITRIIQEISNFYKRKIFNQKHQFVLNINELKYLINNFKKFISKF
jgi:hypothetical protein